MERSYGDEANTVKLTIDVELLMANYKELKDSLYFIKSQVNSLVTENITLKSKLKLLEEEVKLGQVKQSF